MMLPLRVTATVSGQVALPHGRLALDSLLASQVALRLGLPPPVSVDDCVPIDIPVALEPNGRFHLCSHSEHRLTEFDLRWVNRRAPVDQYHQFGVTGRVQITGGPDKSYRLPLEVGHLVDSCIRWWCIGERSAIEELLSTVIYLGKKRASGLGKVDAWTVEPCDDWLGFPVVRDGKPLRPLPHDWPGLVDAGTAYATLTYPYWSHADEVLCAVPDECEEPCPS